MFMLFVPFFKRCWQRIIGTLPATALAVGGAAFLAGCSMVSLGYNRLPDIGLVWLERQIDLDSEQAVRARTEMQTLLQWHRSTQLRPTADLLQRWQTMARNDINAGQACQDFAQVRGLLDTLTEQAVPAITRLAIGITPEQWPSLVAAQRKGNDEFRRLHLGDLRKASWLPGNVDTEAPGVTQRLQTLVDRYTTLYGTLNPGQQALLRQAVVASDWQPERNLAERERRQTDLLATLKRLQGQSDGPSAQALVRGWLARLNLSPTPGYAAYAQAQLQAGCTLFAAMHQAASTEQRLAAVATLGRYEKDLRALAAR